jgi:hypothetical protein
MYLLRPYSGLTLLTKRRKFIGSSYCAWESSEKYIRKPQPMISDTFIYHRLLKFTLENGDRIILTVYIFYNFVRE